MPAATTEEKLNILVDMFGAEAVMRKLKQLERGIQGGLGAIGKEKGLKQIPQMTKTMEKNFGNINTSLKRFRFEQLGLLFGLRAISKSITGFLKQSIKSYDSAFEKQGQFRKELNKGIAAFEFFKFRLIDALGKSGLFIAIIDAFAKMFDFLGQLDDDTLAAIAISLGAIAAISGIGAVAAQLALLWDSILLAAPAIAGLDKFLQKITHLKGITLPKLLLAGTAIAAYTLGAISLFTKDGNSIIEDLTTIGGATAAGAVIGSMIAPGIGTAIGAAIGLAIGTTTVIIDIVLEAKNRLTDEQLDQFISRYMSGLKKFWWNPTFAALYTTFDLIFTGRGTIEGLETTSDEMSKLNESFGEIAQFTTPEVLEGFKKLDDNGTLKNISKSMGNEKEGLIKQLNDTTQVMGPLNESSGMFQTNLSRIGDATPTAESNLLTLRSGFSEVNGAAGAAAEAVERFNRALAGATNA